MYVLFGINGITYVQDIDLKKSKNLELFLEFLIFF